MSQFESLGDNCEFGLLQRAHGFDYSNILRWSFVFDNESLLQLIDCEFKGAFQFEHLTPRGGGNMVNNNVHRIAFHSALHSKQHGHDWHFIATEEERRRIHEAETSKIKHLIEKTVRNFRSANRVFVYKKNTGVHDDVARALLAQLRKYNPDNQLLLLVLPGHELSPGDLMELEAGLFKGCLDRFAPYDKADDFSESVWIKVLEKVSSQAATKLAPTGSDKPAELSVRQAKCDTIIRHRLESGRLCEPPDGIEAPSASVLVANYVAVHGDLMELSNCALNGRSLPLQKYFVTNSHWDRN